MDSVADNGWRLPVSQRSAARVGARCGWLAAAVALASCGGGGDGGGAAQSPAPAATAPRAVSQSDLEIAQAVYGGSPRTPDGFYSDSAPSGHDLVATTHLKNTDLAASGPTAPSYELCTDDWNEALAWSESSAQQAAQYADLVATIDDARYFEFGRVRAGAPQLYQRSRVFKCAYLDRSSANLRSEAGPAGRLNRRPLGATELRTLSEYLWQFTTYNNFGHVVLKSAGEATASGFSHTLHIGALTRGGASASCDRIDVIAWRHELNAATGALERTATKLWSFGARENAGVAELCSG
jgi:hypothetical protein